MKIHHALINRDSPDDSQTGVSIRVLRPCHCRSYLGTMKANRRDFLKGIGGAALVPFCNGETQAEIPHGVGNQFVWERLNIGASGFSTGLDIQADGLGGVVRAVRTDTNGAFVMPAGATKWRQCFTATSLPSTVVSSAYPGFGFLTGCWEIAIAPNNVNRLYAMYQYYNTGIYV